MLAKKLNGRSLAAAITHFSGKFFKYQVILGSFSEIRVFIILIIMKYTVAGIFSSHCNIFTFPFNSRPRTPYLEDK
jgi:hypothetical protein